MTSPLETLREALQLCVVALQDRVEEPDQVYGSFIGGDPRDFSPDSECSTDEERAAHKADCAAWDRGERTYSVQHGRVTTPLEGGGLVSASFAGYGLGVNTLHDSLGGVLERARAALAAVEGQETDVRDLLGFVEGKQAGWADATTFVREMGRTAGHKSVVDLAEVMAGIVSPHGVNAADATSNTEAHARGFAEGWAACREEAEKYCETAREVWAKEARSAPPGVGVAHLGFRYMALAASQLASDIGALQPPAPGKGEG